MSATGVKSSKIFYGWFIVAACFAVTFTLGESFWSFGVYFKPLQNEFGWSRTVVSSCYTAFMIGYAVSVVTAGRLTDRYNPRLILLAGALSAGLGIILCSQANDINQLRVFMAIAGIGAGATWSIPTSVVQRWFYGRPNSGLALSIVVSGVGVGAFVFAPLTNYLILNYGWRMAYLVTGLIFFVIISLSSIIIRNRPSESPAGKNHAEANSLHEPGLRTSRVLVSASFIAITFSACAAIMAFQVLSVHLIPHATDIGISPTAAAFALGLIGALSVPGRIFSGILSDKVGWQKLLVFSLFGTALSIILLIFLQSEWMLYCFVFFYGLCHGFRNVAWIGSIGEFFGIRSLGELIGISSAVSQFTGAFSPYLAGFMFDKTNSYTLIFLCSILILLVAGIFVAKIRKPTRKTGGPA